MSHIIGNYIVKKYLKNFLYVALTFALFILLIDYLEGSRKFSRDGVEFWQVFLLSLLKLPEIISQLFFFLVFISVVISFNQLLNSSELVILQTSGKNLASILAKFALVIFLLGIFNILLLKPVSLHLRNLYLHKVAVYSNKYSQIETNEKFPHLGIWLTQRQEKRTEYLINIKSYNVSAGDFQRIYFVCIECKEFAKGTIVSAANARLVSGKWLVKDVNIQSLDGKQKSFVHYEIGTNLNKEVIFGKLVTESVVQNQLFNIWTLPELINLVEDSGLSAQYLYVYLFEMLMTPLFFLALAVLAVALNIKLPRMISNMQIYTAAIIYAFIFFFFKNLLFGLALAENLPIFLGVINPILIILSFSIYKFLQRESSK